MYALCLVLLVYEIRGFDGLDMQLERRNKYVQKGKRPFLTTEMRQTNNSKMDLGEICSEYVNQMEVTQDPVRISGVEPSVLLGVAATIVVTVSFWEENLTKVHILSTLNLWA